MKLYTLLLLFFISFPANSSEFSEIQRAYKLKNIELFLELTQKMGAMERLPSGYIYKVSLMYEAIRENNRDNDSSRIREANFTWLRHASDQGDPRAMYKIAQAYILGIGTPINKRLARQFFKKARSHGVKKEPINPYLQRKKSNKPQGVIKKPRNNYIQENKISRLYPQPPVIRGETKRKAPPRVKKKDLLQIERILKQQNKTKVVSKKEWEQQKVWHKHGDRSHIHSLPKMDSKHRHTGGELSSRHIYTISAEKIAGKKEEKIKRQERDSRLREIFIKNQIRHDKCTGRHSYTVGNTSSAQNNFEIQMSRNNKIRECKRELITLEVTEKYKKSGAYSKKIEQPRLARDQFRCIEKNLSLIKLYNSKRLHHIEDYGFKKPSISIIYPSDPGFIQPLKTDYIYYLNNFFNINACIVLYDDSKIGGSKLLSTSYSAKGYDGTILVAKSLFLNPKKKILDFAGLKSELNFLSMMLAHEYAHLYLNSKNYKAVKTKKDLHNRVEELLCDFLAGFYYIKHDNLWKPIKFKGKVLPPTGSTFTTPVVPNFSKDFLSFWGLNDYNSNTHLFNTYGPASLRYIIVKKGAQYAGGYFFPSAYYDQYLRPMTQLRYIDEAYREGLEILSHKRYSFNKSNMRELLKTIPRFRDDAERWLDQGK